jgi:hypothetical protein
VGQGALDVSDEEPKFFHSTEHQPLSGVVKPSKYRADNLQKDWNHWVSMQKKGLHGLIFHNAPEKDIRWLDRGDGKSKGKGKGKAKVSYVEPSDDSSSSGEEKDIGKSKSKGKGKARALAEDSSSSGEEEDMGVEGEASENEDEDEDEQGDRAGKMGAAIDVEMAKENESGRVPTPPPSTPRSAVSQGDLPTVHESSRPTQTGLPRPMEITLPRPTTITLPQPNPGNDFAGSSAVDPDIPAANHGNTKQMVKYPKGLSGEKPYKGLTNTMLMAEGYNMVCN